MSPARFRDAVWWAMATVSAVGYGNRSPVTDQGRFVAGVLAVIALWGIMTASFASWVLDR